MLKIMPFVAETNVKNNAICGRIPLKNEHKIPHNMFSCQVIKPLSYFPISYFM